MGGGGDFLMENPRRKGVSARVFGGNMGGGAKYFFGGPKVPPRIAGPLLRTLSQNPFLEPFSEP